MKAAKQEENYSNMNYNEHFIVAYIASVGNSGNITDQNTIISNNCT